MLIKHKDKSFKQAFKVGKKIYSFVDGEFETDDKEVVQAIKKMLAFPMMEIVEEKTKEEERQVVKKGKKQDL